MSIPNCKINLFCEELFSKMSKRKVLTQLRIRRLAGPNFLDTCGTLLETEKLKMKLSPNFLKNKIHKSARKAKAGTLNLPCFAFYFRNYLKNLKLGMIC